MAKMYGWEKPLREEKSRKNPSFSSTLLDEIYRSIDGGDERMGGVKLQKDNTGKKQSGSGGGGRAKASSTVEDEEMESLRRACLIEKWMEKKVNEKVSGGGSGRMRRSSLPEFDRRSVLDNDPLFFSSSSSSSESSLGFNEPDVFNEAKSKPSCFAPFRPKPVKTSVSAKSAKQNEFYFFDDDSRNHHTNKTDDGLIRSKARALKIYASLKKVKQPISPGGRLTSFLNSIFANGNGKKGKDLNSPEVYKDDDRAERKSKLIQGSTCSSASSFSRSCLSKTSPRSREMLSNGVKRTVRFYPVSVIVDEDCRPCGQKIICDEDLDNFGRSLPLQRNEGFQIQRNGKELSRNNQNQKSCNGKELSKNYQNHKEKEYLATNINDHDDFDDDDDDDDMASDASSDLFELDHLKVFKYDRFCEELPVYETTHFGTNRAIASGLIR